MSEAAIYETAYFFGSWPQTRMDYDGANNLIYLGRAKKGASSAALAWKIWKYTYDGSNNLTLIQSSTNDQAWDNRATSVVYS